jgi:hypothetical protein
MMQINRLFCWHKRSNFIMVLISLMDTKWISIFSFLAWGVVVFECVQDTHAFDDQRKEIFNCTRRNQLKLQPLCMLFFLKKKKKVAQHIYNKESRWKRAQVSVEPNLPRKNHERAREVTSWLLSTVLHSAGDSSSLLPREEHLPQLSLLELV